MTRKTIKSALEAMMFTWGEPLGVKIAAEVFNEEWHEIYDCFKELQAEYQQEGRGIRIREVDKAFQFVTDHECADYVERLCTPVKKRKLSQSALEVLAIVAYKQPVTKAEIEAVRGVRCDRVMEGLVNKGLVKEVGRTEGVGRPVIYGTTEEFLKHFGFSSIRELPEIDDIDDIINDEYGGFEVYAGKNRAELSPDFELD